VVRTRGQVRMDRIFGPRFLEFSKIFVPLGQFQEMYFIKPYVIFTNREVMRDG